VGDSGLLFVKGQSPENNSGILEAGIQLKIKIDDEVEKAGEADENVEQRGIKTPGGSLIYSQVRPRSFLVYE
jgi:hypothetical protein